MRKRVILFLTLTQILFILVCGKSIGSQKRPEVTFYSDQSGLSTSLYMIFDLNNSGMLCDRDMGNVVLNSPSESINPWTGFSSGDFIVSVNDKEAIVFGSYFFAEAISDNVKKNIAVFKRKGAGEKAIGATNEGKIFCVDSNKKSTQIGECRSKNIITPDGIERTVIASRLLVSNSKWLVTLGDKIFSIEKNDQLIQVGWVDWRKIITPEGKQLVILMTKGMDKSDKWAGCYDGKLYHDK